ncbi:MAG: hypothetical protein OCD76_17140 [Reichenbachiella sp.]
MIKNILLISFVTVILSSACAPEKNNAFSDSYHNTTSKYNSWYVANEDIKEIERIIEESYDWNYNLILPVFPQFDTILAQSYHELIEHCITKASLSIQYHKGSNWEDNSYLLVGKARFYDVDYVNAIETFKYVNTKGKGDTEKHEALVALMRTFIEYHELNNAIAVSDYLKREQLNKKNLKNLYLTRAYLYQKRDDLDGMVRNLVQAEELISNSNERARMNFIIGQVYQSLGLQAEAYTFYKQTLRNNPPYELSFYTKLNMAQVTQLANTNDLKKIRKYFKKLLKDRKNVEFKDKIYYEMAKFEVRHDNLELGIEHYNSSVRSSTTNNRQKAHSYWELGKIYYDSLVDYKTAKLYYDSTLSVLPRDEIEYEAIQARSDVLSNFVEQLTIIHDNDSVLHLTTMSETEISLFLDDYIAKQEAEEIAQAKEEKRKKREQEQLAAQQFNDPFASDSDQAFGSNNYEGSLWYFYNPSAVARGSAQFVSIWGNRELEDNWRRKSKLGEIREEVAEEIENPTEKVTKKDRIEEDEANINSLAIKKDGLISQLPNTDEQKQLLLDEVETATYKLGNIYNFELNEDHNAIDTYETLLIRFPNSEFKPEVLYLLYLLYNEAEDSTKSDYYKDVLKSEFPDSLYAKLIDNPHYREDSQLESEKLQKDYAKAYTLYQEGLYEESLALLNESLANYTDNDFIDNAQLLKIILTGKTASIYQYEVGLKQFLADYLESELVPYVESLVVASEQFQINLTNSTSAKYLREFNQEHLFVFVYETDPELAEALPPYFENMIAEEEGLKVGNLLLDDYYSMVMISEFRDKKSAEAFNQKIETDKPDEKIKKSGKFYNFVITQDNFNIFYQTKELENYLKFYRKNYLVP